MTLTEYDKKTFENIQKLTIGKWYSIDEGRPDKLDLLESLKKFYECYGILEFDDDFTKFRIVLRENKVEAYLNQQRAQNNAVESTNYIQMDKVTEERNKSLTSSKLASNFKSIPCFRSRPDIGEKILREEAERKAVELKRSTEENDRQERIKAWKNG